jgi:hypothetical protein
MHLYTTEVLAHLGLRFLQNWHTGEISFLWQAPWIASTQGLFLTFWIAHCWLSNIFWQKDANKAEHIKKKKSTQTFSFPFPYSSLAKFGMAYAIDFFFFSFPIFLCLELAEKRYLFGFKRFSVGLSWGIYYQS